MKTVPILETTNGQAVPLPDEFRFETPTVSIRRDGEAVEPDGLFRGHSHRRSRICPPRSGVNSARTFVRLRQ